ncbi:hypothetical protein FRB99_005774 [Tulasnella sp. 403]|nr:hypothetical protein FRB99_005774 [Tulasnella sp. 403]
MNFTMKLSTSSFLHTFDPIQQTPWYYTGASSIIPGIQDKTLTLVAPIAAYWSLSCFFHLLDVYSTHPPFTWLGAERYRIHESEEMRSRNKTTPGEVFRAVIFQQVIQTALGIWWLGDEQSVAAAATGPEPHFDAMCRLAPWIVKGAALLLGEVTAASLMWSYGQSLVYWVYWWIIPTLQFFFAFFVIDTWQYFLHRLFHVNKFLYRNFHSVHHRLYVPYAYGALYNHPLEGFVLDSLGAAIAETLSGLTVRQASLLFGFSAAKTVDDHCGFSLPWDPLQFLYKNNARYHDVHHQTYGLKYNFSQPFWIHWDIIMGTRWDKPERPLAAEKRAMALAELTKAEKDLAHDSDDSSDSGVAIKANKQE